MKDRFDTLRSFVNEAIDELSELDAGGDYMSVLGSVLDELNDANKKVEQAHALAPTGVAKAVVMGMHSDLFNKVAEFRQHINQLRSMNKNEGVRVKSTIREMRQIIASVLSEARPTEAEKRKAAIAARRARVRKEQKAKQVLAAKHASNPPPSLLRNQVVAALKAKGGKLDDTETTPGACKAWVDFDFAGFRDLEEKQFALKMAGRANDADAMQPEIEAARETGIEQLQAIVDDVAGSLGTAGKNVEMNVKGGLSVFVSVSRAGKAGDEYRRGIDT